MKIYKKHPVHCLAYISSSNNSSSNTSSNFPITYNQMLIYSCIRGPAQTSSNLCRSCSPLCSQHSVSLIMVLILPSTSHLCVHIILTLRLLRCRKHIFLSLVLKLAMTYTQVSILKHVKLKCFLVIKKLCIKIKIISKVGHQKKILELLS